jgi:hypothetical protein
MDNPRETSKEIDMGVQETEFNARTNTSPFLEIHVRPSSTIERIAADRKRTNILSVIEQPTLAFLCRWVPAWVTSDMLTLLGLAGSVIVMIGFWLAIADRNYLWICVAGFALQWLGDSLDGRIAYYRNIPRKWYGFALDLSMDWISIILIGLGFYFFLGTGYQILAFTFVTAYGWSMMLALLKYKVADIYNIDMGGAVGPTEFRIAICIALLSGTIYLDAVIILAIAINIVVYAVNFKEFYEILSLGNKRDIKESVGTPV